MRCYAILGFFDFIAWLRLAPLRRKPAKCLILTVDKRQAALAKAAGLNEPKHLPNDWRFPSRSRRLARPVAMRGGPAENRPILYHPRDVPGVGEDLRDAVVSPPAVEGRRLMGAKKRRHC